MQLELRVLEYVAFKIGFLISCVWVVLNTSISNENYLSYIEI